MVNEICQWSAIVVALVIALGAAYGVEYALGWLRTLTAWLADLHAAAYTPDKTEPLTAE